MYHPLLIFERHTGCLLAARLRRGTAPSHARIVPLLLRLVPRLQKEFPKVRIKLRADAGFALSMGVTFFESAQATFIIPLAGGTNFFPERVCFADSDLVTCADATPAQIPRQPVPMRNVRRLIMTPPDCLKIAIYNQLSEVVLYE